MKIHSGSPPASVCWYLIAVFATVTSLHAQAGSAAPQRALVPVAGVVYDSLARRPLAGAEVHFVREGAAGERLLFDATSDARGRFTLGVAPGAYTVGFFHSRLDSLDLDAPVLRVVVGAHAAPTVLLAISSVRTLTHEICEAVESSDSSTLFLGRVRDAATRALVDGRFAVCNAPADAELIVRAVQGSDSSGVILLRFPAERVLARDLFIGWSEPATPDSIAVVDGARRVLFSPRRGQARLTGSVREPSGKALQGARVQVLGRRAARWRALTACSVWADSRQAATCSRCAPSGTYRRTLSSIY